MTLEWRFRKKLRISRDSKPSAEIKCDSQLEVSFPWNDMGLGAEGFVSIAFQTPSRCLNTGYFLKRNQKERSHPILEPFKSHTIRFHGIKEKHVYVEKKKKHIFLINI